MEWEEALQLYRMSPSLQFSYFIVEPAFVSVPLPAPWMSIAMALPGCSSIRGSWSSWVSNAPEVTG